MSETAYELLQKEKEKVLERQQVCAYCNKVCKNADHLYIHILLNHKEK